MSKKISYIKRIIIFTVVVIIGFFIIENKINKNKVYNQETQVIDVTIIESKENLIKKDNQIKNKENILEQKIIPKKEEQKKITEKPKIIKFVCPTPKIEYEDNWLLNIGQDIGLEDETYIPKNLVKIENEKATQNNLCLIQEAKDSLDLMLAKAKSEGYDIKVSSAFRTYEIQKFLLDKSINSGNINADLTIAKAGYSEHQLGTTIDITGMSINYVGASYLFINTPEAEWMKSNASSYGFIESYPQGKENITGYVYEPWHYRYVGIENAKEIIKNEQTVNEYLQTLQ